METINNFLILVAVVIFLVVPPFTSASYYTLPIDVNPATDISAWFDHDTTASKKRYDGETNFSYNDHHGVDFITDFGTNVFTAASGTVAAVGWEDPDEETKGYGFRVYLYHSDNGQRTLYGHMASTTAVSLNDSLLRGELLGVASSTGTSTAPHLHFGVYDCDCTATTSQVDPFGWSGGGSDPWPHASSTYLWTTNPPSLDLTLTTELVSTWLSDDSGLTTDLHGSNDLTDNNTVTLLDDGGQNGDAGDFEASNGEYLSITDASQTGLDLSTELSIAAWIHVESTGVTDRFIVAKGDVNLSTRDIAYGFWVNDDDSLEFRTSDNGTLNAGHNVDVQTSTSQITSTSTDYHVVFTFDVATETGVMYINGSSVTTTKQGSMGSSIRNNDDFFAIGTRESNGSPSSSFDGTIHQVAVWDRILSSSEVAELYNSGNGIFFSSF